MIGSQDASELQRRDKEKKSEWGKGRKGMLYQKEATPGKILYNTASL